MCEKRISGRTHGDNETKGVTVLNIALDTLPIENAPTTVIGQVSINFVVKANYASPPIGVRVRK